MAIKEYNILLKPEDGESNGTASEAPAVVERKIPGGVYKTWGDYYTNSARLKDMGGGIPFPIQNYRDNFFSDFQYRHKDAYSPKDDITYKYRVPVDFNGEDLTNKVNRFTTRVWNPDTNQYEYKHGYWDQTDINHPKQVYLEDGEDGWRYFDGTRNWQQTDASGAVMGPRNVWYYYNKDNRYDENGKPIQQTTTTQTTAAPAKQSTAVTSGTQGKTSMANPVEQTSKLADVVARRQAYNGLA